MRNTAKEPDAAAMRALHRAAECLVDGDLPSAVQMAALAAHLVESGKPETLFGSRLREKESQNLEAAPQQ